jgi:predicted aspartyl protease
VQLRGVAALFAVLLAFALALPAVAQTAAPAPEPSPADGTMQFSVSAVRFPDGVSRVSLPVRFDGTLIEVTVTIGGRPYLFFLDTGASSIYLTDVAARAMGIATFNQSKGLGVSARPVTTTQGVVPEMRIGPLTMRDVTVQVGPPIGFTPDVVGLIGFDFLVQLGVTIDYEHRTVTVVPSAAFKPPAGSDVHILDVDLHGRTPKADVVINGVPSSNFVIDSGDGGSFLIFDSFARAHPEALPATTFGSDSPTSYGVGETAITSTAYRIRDLRLGKYMHFANFIGTRTTDASPGQREPHDGLFGSGFLRYFTVYLDYADSTIYFRRNGVTIQE